MKLKENAPILETGDFWYDLFQGGYVKFSNYVEEPLLSELIKAKQLLQEFENALDDNELIEWM